MSIIESKKYLFPEVYLYDAINDINKRSRNKGFNPRVRHRNAYVVEYANVDFEIKDIARNGTIIPYPKHYARIWVDGLDNNLPRNLCRVFKPPTQRPTEKLEPGDMVWIEFEDESMSQGVWLGKVKSKVKEIDIPPAYDYEKEYGYFQDSKNVDHTRYDKVISPSDKDEIGAIKLSWPIHKDDHSTRDITSPFNATRGREWPHKGVDISSGRVPITPINWPIDSFERAEKIKNGQPGGSPSCRVIAACDSVVENMLFSWGGNTKNMGSYAITLKAAKKYPKEFKTRYIHVYKPQINEGDFIKEGRIIAYVAPVDNISTGPHLHFETRVISNNIEVAVNPLKNNVAHL